MDNNNFKDIVEGIEFHDQPLNSIEFDFLNQKICYGIDIYNEDIEDYDSIELSFEGVKEIKVDEFSIIEVRDLTIASIKIEKNKEGNICRSIFLDDVEGGIIKVEFTFMNLQKKDVQSTQIL